MNKSKHRHHYIPVFYLKGFTDPQDDSRIWVYDKDDEKVFNVSPEKIAFERHYHTFINEEGEKDSDSIEDLLSNIEGESAEVIRKIHSRDKLTPEDKMSFAVFVATMMVRIPNYRKNMETAITGLIGKMTKVMASNKEAFHESYKRFQKAKDISDDMDPEEIRKFMESEDYKLSVRPDFMMFIAFNQIQELARVFFTMNWLFVEATNEHKYLTGDNPLFYCDPTHKQNSIYGVGLTNDLIEVTLPLSNELCAYASWHGEFDYNHVPGRNNIIKSINKRTISSSLRFVFASIHDEKTLLRFITKYKGSAPVVRIG